MKRNQKKETKSRRPLKKLIALWVVFAMLVVPFANHVGKDDAKAEGNSGAGTKVTLTEALSVTANVEFDVATDSTGNITAKQDNASYVLLKGQQKLVFNLTGYPVDAQKIAVYYKAFGENEAITDTVSQAESGLTKVDVNSGLITLENDSKNVAFYAAKVEDDGTISSDYVKQYQVNVKFIDTMFTANDGIYDTENNRISAGSTITSGKVVAGATEAGNNIKYYISDTDLANKGDAPAYSESNSIVATTTLTTKHVYVAYIVDNIVLEYKDLGSVKVIKDEKKPEVNTESWTLKESTGSGFADIEQKYIENNVYYGNKAQYEYTFKVEDKTDDANGASGVSANGVTASLVREGSSVQVTVMPVAESEGTYKVTINKTDLSTDTPSKLKVTVKDAVGNSADYESPIAIQQVKEKELEVASVKFVGDDSSLTSTGVSNINATKTVEVVFNTTKYENLYDVEVVDEASVPYVLMENYPAFGEVSSKRERTITIRFNVPAASTTADAETTIQNLKMQYKESTSDADSKTVDLSAGTIKYDPNPPVISTPQIERSSDSSFTNPVQESADSTGNTYFTEPDVPYYRYSLTVEDAATGSGVKEVYAKIGDTKISFTRVNDTDVYVYDCSSSLSSETPYSLTVYAEDNAGNVSSGTTLRSIQKVDTALKASYDIISKETGNALTSSEVTALLNKKYTNKKYQIKITATSAYKIDSITMYSSAGEKTGSVTGNVEAEKVQNRYSASATFDIPDGDANQFFENLYFVIKDDKAQELNYPGIVGGNQQYLGSILYDHTVPTLSVDSVEDKWYKSYTLNYKFSSGAQLPESPLTKAAYAVSNGKKNPTKNHAENETGKSFTGSIDIPESQSVEGTAVTFTAQDACLNAMQSVTYRVKVDKTAPLINFSVNGKSTLADPIQGDVSIKANVSDNLTIQKATIHVQGPNTDVEKSICNAGNAQNNSFTLDNLLGKKAADGAYTATVYVADKAGNDRTQTISFVVDNTIPVVTAKIADGTTAGKQPGKNFDGTDCDYFYRSNVSVLLTYEDDNLAASGVVVTDNGTKVNVQWTRVGTTNKYQGYYTVTRDGAHTIKINAKDQAGNDAVAKQIVFIKDTVAPAITAVINGGMIYNESMGEVDLTSNSVVAFSVNDANEDVNDFNYQLIKTLPDQNPVTADVIKTDNRSFGFSDEADYVVKAYSVDKAGNRGAERTVQFRIDKTAPELQISGSSSGATLNSGTTLTFSMTEAFWRDASGTITITRKASDSAAEATYKTIDFKPTGRVTTMTETLSETGEYKVTFTGKDRAGHTAEASSYTVRIDTGKPIITLSGVSNNDKTTKQVEFQAQIEEDFYLTKSVSIQATRTYLDTTSYKEKTEDLQITGYNPTAATTLIRNTFTEDGVYKILVTCKDAAGNEDTQEVSFTIDKTKPVIDAKVLAAYEGTLTKFAWDYDLNDIIYDLTVCDVHMYLNGSEYDGTSEIEDGAYEMKITAEDELGNKTEETVNFNLDTKAPTFIVTGVEDGEIKNEQYDINVSLQLDEDTLDEVSLNGSPVEIKDNAAAITVTEKGDYKLTMKAHDDAGNEAEKTISFTYGEKSHVLLYVLIGVGTLVIIGGAAAFIIAGKKKKND